jgi:Ca2+-binding RTX toxin-like protein
MATYTGDSSDNIFTGGTDSDIIAGGGGKDQLSGGGGDDTLYSADVSPPFTRPYYGNPWTPPLLDRGADADTLNGGDGTDTIFAGYGDNVDGGSGQDFLYISFMGAQSGVTADFNTASLSIGGGTISGIEGVAWLEGSDFADTLTLNGVSADFGPVFGMGGDDHILGSYYTGEIWGGDGNDTLDNTNAGYGMPMHGEAGDDVLIGGSGYETLTGDAGNDEIYGNYGYDNLFGGDGDDLMDGGSFGDNLQGGNGNDTMYGAGDADVMEGGAGDDTMFGDFSTVLMGNAISPSSNNDAIYGGDGADVIHGDEGDDLLASAGSAAYGASLDDLGAEKDQLFGGDGNDTVHAGYGDDADGGADHDTLYVSLAGAPGGVTLDTSVFAGGGSITLAGGTLANFETLAQLRTTEFADDITVAGLSDLLVIEAAGGDDVVQSGLSSVDLRGGDGDDLLISGQAGDIFDGGAGSDTVDYSQSASGVTVTLGGSAGGAGSGAGGDQLIAVENIVGSDEADTLSGSDVANRIEGRGGNDTIQGLAGADTLLGGAGDDSLDGGDGGDVMVGGAGDDLYLVDNAGDVVTEAGGEGSDTVRSTLAAYALTANVERLEFTGVGNATLIGNLGANTILGGAGNDTIDGGAGADTLKGSKGDDIYLVDNPGDIVTELAGEGTDTVRTALAAYALGAELENLEFTGVGAATLTGNALANKITGGTGADTMAGGASNDTYVVDNAGDVVIEATEQGSDTVLVATTAGLTTYTLSATAEVEVLKAADPASKAHIELYGNDFGQRIEGNAGDDFLDGGKGDDALYGMDGNDDLNGGEGADTMSGGKGDDFYLVETVGDVVIELASQGTDRVFSYLSEYTLPDNVENLGFGSLAILGTGNALNNEMSIITIGSGTLRGLGGDDTLATADGDNTLDGGDGNDTLTGGAGVDTLTGGIGNDLFSDTAAGLNGDTIIDFTRHDRIRISDADLAGFSASLSGDTLTYTGGSLTLLDVPDGYHLVTSALAGGGVELSLEAAEQAPFRLFVQSGFAGEIGGHGAVLGTNGNQDISLLDVRGDISLDPSFSRGGDIVRLAGDAASYTIARLGSSAVLEDADSSVTIPVGSVGMTIVFADGARTLIYDAASASMKIGEAQFSSSAVEITAPPQAGPLPDIGDPAASARLFLASGAETTVNGTYQIFGTASIEHVTYRGGNVTLDPSFNRGGDVLGLAHEAQDYTAALVGSSIVLESDDGRIVIPLGTTGMMLDFAGDDRLLQYDTETAQVFIDNQVISSTSAALIA